MIIRTFDFSNDYASVINLWLSAGDGIHLSRSDEPDEIIKKLQRDPELFIVADLNGEIIGTVIGGFDGRRGLMYHLAVKEGHRNQGVASKLVDELETRVKSLGCIKCYLLVVPDNDKAKSFYEKNGWSKMDILIYGKELR